MKNFLKLTAVFACFALGFAACNSDDTVDGYIPVLEQINPASVVVKRGDGKIQVTWDIPDDEYITYSKITWSGTSSGTSSGTEIFPVTAGQQGFTFTIGVDDEDGEKGTSLVAGDYSVTIHSMEGRYVGNSSWSTDAPVTVYDKSSYTDDYPVPAKLEHETIDAATITWGTGSYLPEDCVSFIIEYYTSDGNFMTKTIEGDDLDNLRNDTVTTTELDDAATENDLSADKLVNGKPAITFTPSFRPSGDDVIADDDNIVTIDSGGATTIAIEEAVLNMPKLEEALVGLNKVQISWKASADVKMSTVELLDENGDPISGSGQTKFDVTYAYVDVRSGTRAVESEVLEASYDSETGIATVNISTTSATDLTEGSTYQVEIINYTSDTVNEDYASTPIVVTDLYIYTDLTYESQLPAVSTIMHDGTNAIIKWETSGLSGYGEDDSKSAYNALYKIIVTYSYNDGETSTDAKTEEFLTEFYSTSETSDFALECTLPYAVYGTNFTYQAIYLPDGAIETDTVAIDSGSGFENDYIPYPELAAPRDITLRSGYNSNTSSYLEVTWGDVAGPLGVINDAIVDVLVFYTTDYTHLAGLDTDYLYDSGTGYTSIGWDQNAPAPISVATLYSDKFGTDGMALGATITIGKDSDGTSADIAADTRYFIAVASVNAEGQFNFTNTEALDGYDFDDSGKPSTTWADYYQRTVLTYNESTYADTANATLFTNEDSKYAPTVARELTDANVTWNWDAAVVATSESKYSDTESEIKGAVIAMSVSSYDQNVTTAGVETGTGSTTESVTSTGDVTTLSNAKAGVGAIRTTIAHILPVDNDGNAYGVDTVAITQTPTHDIPYLRMPTNELTLKTGVNDGNETNDTLESGESYINASWTISSANSSNVGSFKLNYQAGTTDDNGVTYKYESSYSSTDEIESTLRTSKIAPEAKEELLTPSVGYSVYLSYVDLDGYTRPLTTDDALSVAAGDVAAADSAIETHTYDYATYADEELLLSGTVEELAFDGSTLTLTWNDSSLWPADIVGVILTMTENNVTYGKNTEISSTFEAYGVETDDEFTYTSYFCPSYGETIVAGATITVGQNESNLSSLKVPVSTAPTQGVFKVYGTDGVYGITSSFSQTTDTPSIDLKWTLADDVNRANIYTSLEDGNKYMCVYCYEDGTDPAYIAKVQVVDAQTEYEYTITDDYITAGKSYTIYIGSENVNNVVYKQYTYAGVKAYNKSAYTTASLPSLLDESSLETDTGWSIDWGYNNDITATWDKDVEMKKDLYNVYLGYNGGYATAVSASEGKASVPYVDGIGEVTFNGGFKPDYDRDLDQYATYYEELLETVTYTEEVLIYDETNTGSVDVSNPNGGVDIAYDDGIYYISTGKGLQAFAAIINGTAASSTPDVEHKSTITDWTQDSSADAIIAKDIDLTDVEWTYIGNAAATAYQGTFDGNDMTISNFTFDTDAQYRGFFGYISGATIKNLTIKNANVASSARYFGAVVGYAAGASLIENCHVDGGVMTNNLAAGGTGETGAITGVLTGSSYIINCSNSATINSGYADYVGGITGLLSTGFVINSHNSGNITGVRNSVGGIAGYVSGSGNQIIGCSNTADIVANAYISGVAGYPNAAVDIIACYNTGGLTSASHYVGGITGRPSGTATINVIGCYNTGFIYSSRSTTNAHYTASVAAYAGDSTFNVEDTYYVYSETGADESLSGYSYIDAGLGNATLATATLNETGVVTRLDATNELIANNPSYFMNDALETYYAGSSIDASYRYYFVIGSTMPELTQTNPDYEEKIESSTTGVYATDDDIKLVDQYYEIYTAIGLATFADIVNGTHKFTIQYEDVAVPSANAKIVNEIDLDDISTYLTYWSPMMNYTGTFDGQDKVISNFKINATTDYQGLFGSTSGATISNVTIATPSIYSEASYVAAIVGTAEDTTITECYVTGESSTITGVNYVAAIAGYISGTSSVTSCENNATVTSTEESTGNAYVGGIIGYGDSPTVSTSTNNGAIFGTGSYIAGIVGYQTGGSIQSCTNNAVITRYDYSGTTTQIANTSLDLGGNNAYGSVEENAGVPIDIKLNGGIYEIYSALGLAAFGDIVTGTSVYTTGAYGILETDDTIDSWSQNLSADAKLMNDIDLSDIIGGVRVMHDGTSLPAAGTGSGSWTPMGGTSTTAKYSGTFDGQNFSIKNLYISAETSYMGLFGYTAGGAEIKNLKLENPYVYQTNANSSTGELVGAITARSNGSIYNCHVTGTEGYIYGGRNTGGLIGVKEGTGDITYCSNSATVYGTRHNGTTGGAAGGIAGTSRTGAVIQYCTNTGSINGLYSAQNVGGIVGLIYLNSAETPTSVKDCTNTGSVTGLSSNVGGIVGYNGAGCTVDGDSSRDISDNDAPTALYTYYNSGVVKGVSSVGGIVGNNEGALSDYENLGVVVINGESTSNITGTSGASATTTGCRDSWTAAEASEALTNVSAQAETEVSDEASETYITVSWDDLSMTTNTSGVKIYYKQEADATYSSVTVSGTETTSKDIYSLLTATTYNIYVVSYNSDGAETTVDTVGGVDTNTLNVTTNGLASEVEISSEEELLAFVERLATNSRLAAKLTASFTLQSAWTPITGYSGTFDGNGQTISGVTISGETNNVGFFDEISGTATIKDLTLAGVSVTSTANNVGAVVGYITEGTVENCTVSGSVTGVYNVGGIAGYNAGGTVDGCSNSATVKSSYTSSNSVMICVGGIVGYNAATVQNSKNLAGSSVTVSSSSGGRAVGGIVGYNIGATALVDGCSNYGTTFEARAASALIGGIVGYNLTSSTISNCNNYADITVSGIVDLGGIVGLNAATVADCNNYGAIEAKTNVGGIAGRSSSTVNGKVNATSNSVNSGDITATDDDDDTAGGIVGKDTGTVSNYNNLGTVTGGGAITGSSTTTPTDCNDLSTYSGDIQEENGTYYIYTAAGLSEFATTVNGGSYSADAVLVKDIDLVTVCSSTLDGGNGISWTPIGGSAGAYTGTFNGNDKTISNLYISASTSYQGLFGSVSGGTVKDVTLSNPKVTVGNDNEANIECVAALVGSLASSATVSGCTVTGAAGFVNATNSENDRIHSNNGGSTGEGADYVAAVVGYCVDSNVVDCDNEIPVTNMAGSTGVVNSQGMGTGGFAGYISGGNIVNCSNSGAVLMYGNSVGGLCGIAISGNFIGCSNSAEVQGNGAYTSGLIGGGNASSTAQVIACYNTGDVKHAPEKSGTTLSGGIIGRTQSGAEVVGCYNYGGIYTSSTTTGYISAYGVAASSPAIAITKCYYVDVTDDEATSGSGNNVNTELTISVTAASLNGEDAISAMNTAIGSYYTTNNTSSDYRYEFAIGTEAVNGKTTPKIVKK